METFIQTYTDKLYNWKKNVFNYATTKEFVEKQTKKDDIEKIKSELNKCIFGNNKTSNEKEEKDKYILQFISELVALRSNITNDNKISNSKEVSNSKPKDSFNFKKKVKNFDSEFPTLENYELLSRKKNYEVLPHHFKNILAKGNKLCNCMKKKHPLVGNCSSCGKIQCLQEGDEVCIICGTPLVLKSEITTLMIDNEDFKNAFNHKEKLLKFQKDFYSKLQIIDDYTDWFEVANNSWIDENQRSFALEKDILTQKMKFDPEWEYSVNFITGEVNQEYQLHDEKKDRDDIAKLFINQYKNSSQAKIQTTVPTVTNKDGHTVCKIIDNDMINKFIKENQDKAKLFVQEKFKVLNDTVPKSKTNHIAVIQSGIKNLMEQDNFMLQEDKGFCLSMHQPWASLLVYGFKRYEGRDWESNFKGKLWIHATSKKPERSLIEEIEDECEKLYGIEHPPFPKHYPTSCVLGAIDMVDCIKASDYKDIPGAFKETSSSNFLFVCKNPRILDIPLKLPGQPKIFNLERETMEKLNALSLNKVNTFWFPKEGLDCEKELKRTLPSKYINALSYQTSKVNKQQTKGKIKNDYIIKKISDSVIYLKDYNLNCIDNKMDEKIFNYIDKFKDNYKYTYDNKVKPYYSQYSLRTTINNDIPDYFNEILSDIRSVLIKGKYFSSDSNFSNLNKITEISIEVISLWGSKNFTKIEENTFVIFLGNPSYINFDITNENILSINETKSFVTDNGDILYIDCNQASNRIAFSIPQILYDTKKSNINAQGTIILTLK